MSPTPQTPPTDRPLTAGGDWIEWHGGENPAGDALVEIKLRNGCTTTETASGFPWDHDEIMPYADIIAYRPARPATSAASEVTTQACVDWDEYTDDIGVVISDSLEMDWTSSDGARAVVRWLNENAPYSAAASSASSAVLVQEIVQALAPDQGERAHPAFSLAIRLQAALASPPVSERERELEGALREAVEFIDALGAELLNERTADWYPGGANNAASHMSETMRLAGNRCADYQSLTAQSAGEGK